jgi:hypothetical protein
VSPLSPRPTWAKISTRLLPAFLSLALDVITWVQSHKNKRCVNVIKKADGTNFRNVNLGKVYIIFLPLI